MTFEYEKDENCPGSSGARLEEIVRHVKHIHQKLDDIASRLDDSYHLLREILETTNNENTVHDHDLYDNENGYD